MTIIIRQLNFIILLYIFPIFTESYLTPVRFSLWTIQSNTLILISPSGLLEQWIEIDLQGSTQSIRFVYSLQQTYRSTDHDIFWFFSAYETRMFQKLLKGLLKQLPLVCYLPRTNGYQDYQMKKILIKVHTLL